ncbi:hypothetical protein ACFPIJ_48105 [Dactylosporangium cerinum]|uniref:Uncharacterized protein n=1 Tax=Dactylosporangium cerinum TaxID=1434730 RepID=A0ABV9WA02_9ACTN
MTNAFAVLHLLPMSDRDANGQDVLAGGQLFCPSAITFTVSCAIASHPQPLPSTF